MVILSERWYHCYMTLPETFKSLLWSYDFLTLDVEKDKKTIVVNTINYGDWGHWRWIARFYGKETIRRLLMTIPASEFRPRVRILAGLLFSIKVFNHAPRGAHRTR